MTGVRRFRRRAPGHFPFVVLWNYHERMSSSGWRALLFFPAVLAFAGSAAGQAPTVKRVPVKLSGSVDGAVLFREHCAVCHGVDAKGDGPAAAALKKAPKDLTQITQRSGGKFPTLAVRAKISGGEVVEHGTIEMPIWGKLLIPASRTKTDADLRIYALVEYLEKTQAR